MIVIIDVQWHEFDKPVMVQENTKVGMMGYFSGSHSMLNGLGRIQLEKCTIEGTFKDNKLVNGSLVNVYKHDIPGFKSKNVTF